MLFKRWYDKVKIKDRSSVMFTIIFITKFGLAAQLESNNLAW